jgi:hypothetical protein
VSIEDLAASFERAKRRLAAARRGDPAARPRARRRPLRELPEAVRRCFHNVDPSARVSDVDIAFACFNVGDLRALSFAAALPLPALEAARARRGFRPKSRALLDAVISVIR